MKSSFHKYVFLVILFLTTLTDINAQDGWLKRKWHDMNARFNGYYNSKVLVNGAIQSLEESNTDNFNQILRVFPYGGEDNAASVKADMDKVFKKCSKVIRKHPNSKWEDECYLLIGQSHFFKYDPYSAIETFQYINKKFKDNETRYDAQIWILKSYLRQERYNDAEAIMGLFIQDKDFPKRLDKELNAIAADIYIQQGKYQPAIEKLELALALTKDRGEKYRWHFILGQLYLQQGNWEKARDHYVRTIKLNPPYDLAFQSNLGLVKTISMGEGSLKTPKKYLNRMLKDDKNIDYYDQIYFELAKIATKEGNTDQAIKYFQQSARTSTTNTDQKASAYLELANIFFQQKEYEKSQAYFDSTVSFISETHPEYDKIKTRHSVLTDLIDNLVEVKTQDSLLRLSEMERKDLDKFIDDLIRKKKDEAERRALEKEMNSFAAGNNQPQGIPQNPNTNGDFYFTNKAAVSRGRAEFTRKWGNRKHTDYWRINAKARNTGTQEEKEEVDDEYQDVSYDESDDKEQQKLIADVPDDKREYYKNIPLSEIGKKIAHQKIEQALFNIALLYEEKLKEYNKAIEYYDRLISSYPDSKKGAETYFHLYKCYKALGDETKAEQYARILDERFKESDYNQVVNNRDVERAPGEEEEVLDLYHKMYAAYKQGNYAEALEFRNQANQKYYGNSIQAKYDYLYAMIVAEQGDTEKYLSLLQAIAENYPGTEIANNATYAMEHYAELQNKEEAKKEEIFTGDYTYEPSSEHYYMVVLDGKNSSLVMAAFADYNKEMHSLDKLKVQSYALGEKQVIAVQTFGDKETAEKYYIEFIKNGKFFKELGVASYDNYYISKQNFKTLLRDQSEEAYSVFFLKNYIQ